MKVTFENDHAIFSEYTVQEKQWLKSILTWDTHQGNKQSVLHKNSEDTLITFAHLLPEIIKKSDGIIEFSFENTFVNTSDWDGKVDPNLLQGITLRPHQVKAVTKGLRHFKGILSLSTGAGKTLILLGLHVASRSKRTILIVPTVYLAEEIYKNAISCGITDVGILSGDKKGLAGLTIAVADSLYSSLKKKDRFSEALLDCELLLADEAHHCQSNSWREMWFYSQAKRKIGVTATPFNNIENDPLASYGDALTASALGPILIHVSNALLVEKDVLAKTYCYYINIPGLKSAQGMPYNKVVDKYIINNDKRNQLIVESVRKAVKFGFSVLVLVSQKHHARLLMEMLVDLKVLCKFQGKESLQFNSYGGIQEVKVEFTGDNNWIDRFADKEWDVLIASPVADEGLNFPDIGFTVLAGGGKSYRKNIQKRGRGSRKKKEGENIAFLIDFIDNPHVFLYHQSRKRRIIMEETGSTIVKDQFEFWRIANRVKESKE